MGMCVCVCLLQGHLLHVSNVLLHALYLRRDDVMRLAHAQVSVIFCSYTFLSVADILLTLANWFCRTKCHGAAEAWFLNVQCIGL